MSVAIDFGYGDCLPRDTARVASPPRRRQAPTRIATVAVLHPPAEPAGTSLRLTRRGIAVLAMAVAALGMALVWLAALSAPASGPAAPPAARVVTVQPGDTLWAIAARVAPNADPMSEVELLERMNHLATVDLVPGQQLRVR